MYGAILGDMIGAPYEFDRGNKTKEFPLFVTQSHFTDDSVMTVAVAEALLDTMDGTPEEIRTAVSLGGDCDTLTCIAGGIAEACYGIPDFIKEECRKRLPDDMLSVCDRFSQYSGKE